MTVFVIVILVVARLLGPLVLVTVVVIVCVEVGFGGWSCICNRNLCSCCLVRKVVETVGFVVGEVVGEGCEFVMFLCSCKCYCC